MPVENAKNIVVSALSPDGNSLLTSDEDGRVLLISVRRRAVLAHLNLHCRPNCISWSPDGQTFAVGVFKRLEIWRAPGAAAREFLPFELVERYPGHHDEVTSVDWSPDSRFVLTSSKDGTAKIYAVARDARPAKFVSFSAHSERLVGCFFAGGDSCTTASGAPATVYAVTRDGKVTVWQWMENSAAATKKEDEEGPGANEGEATAEETKKAEQKRSKAVYSKESGRWVIESKKELGSPGQKVKCCTYHRKANLLVVGFNRGVFALYSAPEMAKLQTLSVSRHSITSVAVNSTGEWIAFASAKLGQLLVWEWRSETYVMKQQGHHHDLNCAAYSPNGQLLVTGADDGKVKLWNTTNWFCFVTFDDHTGPVTAAAFAPNGLSVVTASLDGTVRAFDLVRYRNYRTLTPPSPTQLSCIALDPSGEIVAAGAVDTFEIFVWSLQTGKLLDVLGGHEGPVSSLAFSPTSHLLASASWDKTVRLWEAFEGRSYREALHHGSDCLAVAWKPDGSELCATSLDGLISFWDPESATLLGAIEGRNDIGGGGRRADDARTAANNPRGRAFTSVCYSPDGECVIAGGESKYVCLYEISRRLLLRRFQTSHNLSLDGVLDFLNSAKMTENGPVDLIDDDDAEVGDDRDGKGDSNKVLPGAKRGDRGERHVRPAIATKCVRFSPDGRSWAAATTEGLLVFSIDDSAIFDPCDLDVEVTAEAVSKAIAAKEFLRALVMAFRLNEPAVIRKAFEAVPAAEIRLVCQHIPLPYLRRLIEHLSFAIEGTPYAELCLTWGVHLFHVHGEYMRQQAGQMAAPLRMLHKQLVRLSSDLTKRCSENRYTLEYISALIDVQQSMAQEGGEEEGDGDEVDGGDADSPMQE